MRAERGFPTAYAFFHKNGGVRKLDFTYACYLYLERGVRLPSPAVLTRIFETLGLSGPAFVPERKELLKAYLLAQAGGGPLFDPVLEATSTREPADGPADFTAEAGRRLLSAVPTMSLEQATALASNPAAFWTFHYLLHSGRRETAGSIGRRLGHSETEQSLALDLLLQQKLVERRRDGTYSSPHFKSDLFAPVASVTPEKAAWSSQQIEKRLLARKDGVPYYGQFFLVLDDDPSVANLVSVFRDAIRKAYLLRPRSPPRKGKLLSVEARIASLVDFGD